MPEGVRGVEGRKGNKREGYRGQVTHEGSDIPFEPEVWLGGA